MSIKKTNAMNDFQFSLFQLFKAEKGKTKGHGKLRRGEKKKKKKKKNSNLLSEMETACT